MRRHFGVQYHPSQVRRILKQYNWSRQKPLKRASQRDEDAIQRWKEERWSALKKAREEGRTIVFVDETGCYLLPLVVKTYAPRGQIPVLRAPLSRDHLSVISGITVHGWLHTHISVRLLVIWDGSPIHRCQEVKAFLASPAGQESIWSSCQPTPPS
ncbi:MAG TPA: winged helix-turn-helix domain-containing protein [Dehalococcoidia bacterium]|nr:winged helix-turn-helix domain-containing protein [Dehalococcoidia bacterium]